MFSLYSCLNRGWMWLLLPEILQYLPSWIQEGPWFRPWGWAFIIILLRLLYQEIHSGFTWKARAWKWARETSPCQRARNRSSFKIISSNIIRFKTHLLNWWGVKYQIIVLTRITCSIIILMIEVFWGECIFSGPLDIPGWKLYRHRVDCDDFPNNDFLK